MSVSRQQVIGTVLLLALAGGCRSPGTLGRNETVVFENTVCRRVADSGEWAVDIRATVCSESWLTRLEPDLLEYLETHDLVVGSAESTILSKRLRPFLDDHPSGLVLQFMVNGTPRELAPSDDSGRILCQFKLSDEDVAHLQGQPKPEPGWISLPVRKAEKDPREFVCRALVLPSDGIVVVSDIDDTIKITDVNNTKEMLRNTFLLPFRPVEGMPENYAAWAKETGASFRYLSESSIELCPPLLAFIREAGYPEGTIDLRQIAWGHSRLKGFMSLAQAPEDFKLSRLERFLTDEPDRAYVLVGDSSQHDPEVYAAIARKYPRQIRLILIHDVTCEDANAPRYKKTFRGLSKKLWTIYRDPVEIRNALAELTS